MQIRSLQEDEIADVVALWNEAAEAEGERHGEYVMRLSNERLAEILDDDNYLPEGALVAEEQGELAGFALGYVQTVDWRERGNLEAMPGRFAGVAVRPRYRRRGIGRRLLQAVEDVLASHGKSVIAWEIHEMPILLLWGIYPDMGPYRFMLSCGYQPAQHDLGLRNDLEEFELTEEVRSRQAQLATAGISVRPYESGDYQQLREFFGGHFPGGWDEKRERAARAPEITPMFIATAEEAIVGFIGPLRVLEPGRGTFGLPAVAPAFRQRGVGTLLLHLALDHLKRAEVSLVTYTTGADNPARFMYFGAGAKLTGVYCCTFRKYLG